VTYEVRRARRPACGATARRTTVWGGGPMGPPPLLRTAPAAVAHRAHAILSNRRRLSWDTPLLPKVAGTARIRLLLRVSDS